jgi:cytochrome c-type biogenesis protein CcmH
MAAASDTPRRPPLATMILVAAAVVAAVSICLALWRTHQASSDGENPAAADWRTVGWAYAEKGDRQASAAAYRRATALEPDNSENWSSLGEALQTASTIVVPEAAAALAKAVALEPADPRARYFLAVQKDLSGDHRGAVSDWLALLRDTPADAPWRSDLARTIEQAAARSKIDVRPQMAEAANAPPAVAPIPGPTAGQLAAAAAIPPGQQDEMARDMVGRLAARLAANPRDAEGWIRLMRSQMVLKEPDRARQALATALAAFEGEPVTQNRLISAAAELGVRPPG